MMQPLGLARAQLTPEQCSFFVHPTYPNQSYYITVYQPSYSQPASFVGYMYTPEGYCLLGASVYVNPTTAVGAYVGYTIDDGSPYWAGYIYGQAASWDQHITFIVPLSGLSRNKRHKFQLVFTCSGASQGFYVFQNTSWPGNFWGQAYGLDISYYKDWILRAAP